MKPISWKKGVFHVVMSDLLGRVFTSVIRYDGEDGDEIHMTCKEGFFRFYHDQGCCEDVTIDSIVGDLNHLVGSPVLLAEEVSSYDETPEGITPPERLADSFTWTFYKLATIKGYVDIRWYGQSNGYYSEEVRIEFTPSNNALDTGMQTAPVEGEL